MDYITKTQKLDYLLNLIQSGEGNTAEFLCEKICTSKRTLYRFIGDLKRLGHKISYCTSRRTYYLIPKEGGK